VTLFQKTGHFTPVRLESLNDDLRGVADRHESPGIYPPGHLQLTKSPTIKKMARRFDESKYQQRKKMVHAVFFSVSAFPSFVRKNNICIKRSFPIRRSRKAEEKEIIACLVLHMRPTVPDVRGISSIPTSGSVPPLVQVKLSLSTRMI